MKSVMHFVVMALFWLCGMQSSYSQELAAAAPGMALETQLSDIRLDPKPLLVAEKVTKVKVAEPKKPKEKKTSKKKDRTKNSDTSKDADGEGANADDSSPSSTASGTGTDKDDAAKNDSSAKSGSGKTDVDGDTAKPVATQTKPASKPAAKAFVKPGFQQFAGNASWYGVPFHGRKTASGEIFDMYKCSAAHKSLPMVSRVLVEDPRTGNTVLVRVNDRGPFVKTRVMDLSREAARKLGTMARGVYYIEATVLGK
ncbi:MAG: septal ring lytic transglycosylase RlpA family protein [Candidatus Obscuribacterales bacterium]|nr:septal ring lytic transglycosylase RlpA family protein [Candidatus Obscuribacterales bacterium]